MTHPIDHRLGMYRLPSAASRLCRPWAPRALFTTAMALAWLGTGLVAPAQVISAAPIPNEFKTAANGLSAGQERIVDDFIAAQIANLKSEKTANERAARKALEDAAAATGDAQISTRYLSTYATKLDKALEQLASPSQPIAVRLNAAIVTARVAARINNSSNVGLTGAATRFVSDPSEAVALWGIKAGKYIVPHLLEMKQSAALDNAIIDATARFKNNASLVEDAYDDFTGDLIIGGATPPPPSRGTGAVTPLVQLMEQRAALYNAAQNAPPAGDAPDLPADPQADNRAFSFIALPELWPATKPNQQQLMCRAGIDLIKQIIPLVDLTPQRVPNVDPPELTRREDLIAVINQAGSAFKVIGSLSAGGGPIAQAADLLTAAKVSAATQGFVLKDRAAALEAALTAANMMAPPIPVKPLPPPPSPTPTNTPSHPAATTPTRPVTAH